MEVNIEKYIYGGYGLARTEKGVVLVRGALPEEKVDIEIVRRKRDFSYAVVKKVLSPSSGRVEPACPYYGSCGGCDLMHADYNYQLYLKAHSFVELALREGLFEKVFPGMGDLPGEAAYKLTRSFVPSPPLHYRNRVSFHSSGNGPAGRIKMGFFLWDRPGEVVDIETCPVVEEAILKTYGKFRELLNRNIWNLNPVNPERPFEFVSMRSSSSGRVNLKIVSEGFNYEPFLELFKDQIENINTIEISTPSGRAYTGKRFLKENFLGYKLRLTNATFFQVNRTVSAELVSDFITIASSERPSRVVEGYAGVGTFTVPAAGHFLKSGNTPEEFIAYEAMPASFNALRRNVRLNFGKVPFVRLKNSPFEKAPEDELASSLLLVDPPREGLSREVKLKIRRALPDRIIYVSCYPPVLLRDLKELLGFYRVEFLRLYDMFPQTHHFEVMVSLKKEG